MTARPTSERTYEPTFDYSVWSPDTIITICQVPWDNSYRDVVSFESEDKRAEYFNTLSINSPKIQIEHMVYLKYGEPIRINTPFSLANKCNYIVVRNPMQPIEPTDPRRTPDTFYYFINDVRYIAPNTTELDIQLDVWMTYYDRIDVNMCYIERGHIGIANANVRPATYRDYLVEPEGFEMGTNYDVVGRPVYRSFQDIEPYIVVVSTAKLDVEFGSVSQAKLESADASFNYGLPNGCEVYAMEAKYFWQFIARLSGAPWVAQCISSISIVPQAFISLGRQVILDVEIVAYELNTNVGGALDLLEFRYTGDPFNIPSRYDGLLKLHTYPYAGYQISNFNGNDLTVQPEFLENPYEINIEVIPVINPPFFEVKAYPIAYNSRTNNATGIPDFFNTGISNGVFIGDTGDWFDYSLTFNDFPQIPVVNNNYMLYLASNQNTLNYMYDSADWSQQKALTSAQLGFDQSTAVTQNMLANMRLQNQNTWNTTGIANQQQLWSGAKGVVSGIAGGLSSGSALGLVGGAGNAVVSAADSALSVNWNNQSAALSTGLNAAQTSNNAALQNYNRDTNYDYAQFAAKGDYAMSIASIQARVNDAKLTPPSTIGMLGGNMFNIGRGLYGVLVRPRRIKDAYLYQIGEYWLRYGYAINRFIQPPADLKCMSHFTYWKMQNAMIRAQIPEVHKNAIRGILESGVTIWNNPDDINDIDFSINKPLQGIRY